MTRFKKGGNDAVEYDVMELGDIIELMHLDPLCEESITEFEKVFGLQFVSQEFGYMTFLIVDAKRHLMYTLAYGCGG